MANRIGIELDGVGRTIFALYCHSALTGAESGEQENACENKKVAFVHIVKRMNDFCDDVMDMLAAKLSIFTKKPKANGIKYRSMQDFICLNAT